MNKIKILFYFMKGDSDGGSDYSLFAHLENLNTQKYFPIIVYREYSPLLSLLEEKGFKIINIPAKKKQAQSKTKNNIKNIRKDFLFKKYLSSLKLLYKAIPEALKLIKIIIDQNIDLLHLNHNLNGDRAGIVAGILTRTKIISHYRGLYKPVPIDIFLAKFILKIICISDFVKQEYISHGIHEEKCITVYNGVDINTFKPSSSSSNTIIIGCIGRLEEWKGQHVLIKAIPDILKIFPTAYFQFIGNGSNKKNLLKLSDSLNVSKSLEFTGSISNIKDRLKEFTIAVHTSIEPEPFGRVVIEAMAMGKTVISTNIGGPTEIISNNVDGFLIEPNSPKNLAKKIIEVLKDEKLNFRIGKRARSTVEEKFRASLTTEKIERTYSIN